jgi:PBP1b-binding outer membrane lipoprotein LpoB
MSTIRSGEGHNVRVTSHRRARTALLAALLAPALLLSACGGESKGKPNVQGSTDLPRGNVKVPDGITLTKAGTALTFGEPAVVAYEPNTQRSSVLSVTVNSVQAGKIADFAAYQLDERTRRSRPYYVRTTVKNIGTGDLSGAAVPLLAVNNTNALVQPSTFTSSSLAQCPSTALPAGFVAGKAYQGCLVYLMPDAGSLVEMSYRPLQAFEPITWKGTILPVKAEARKDAGAKVGDKKKKANP